MLAKQLLYLPFIAAEIAEALPMFEREFQRLEGVIETHQSDRASNLPRRSQHRQRIGRGSKSDIPNDERARMLSHPFDQAELPDIQSFGFSNRTDDGVKCFLMRQRMNAMDATGELDEFVCGRRCHEGNFQSRWRETKLNPAGRSAVCPPRRSSGGVSSSMRQSITCRVSAFSRRGEDTAPYLSRQTNSGLKTRSECCAHPRHNDIASV